MTLERAWVAIGWTLLLGSLIGWPLSALTFASGEPLVVLSLAWVALAYSAANVLNNAQTQKKLLERLGK